MLEVCNLEGVETDVSNQKKKPAPMKLRIVAGLATSSFKICDNQFIFWGEREGLRWGGLGLGIDIFYKFILGRGKRDFNVDLAIPML